MDLPVIAAIAQISDEPLIQPNVHAGKLRLTIGFSSYLDYLRRDHGSSAIALSPDGQRLATSDLANTTAIAIWKISND